MVKCNPCFGIGVRHLQYFLYGVLIMVEYWMQEITFSTLQKMIVAQSEGKRLIGPSEMDKVTQSAYLFFGVGRLTSGFIGLKVNNKYVIIVLMVIESSLATTCYWFVLHLSFTPILITVCFLGFCRAFHWALLMNIMGKWMPTNEITTANAIIIIIREAFSLLIKFYTESTSFMTTRYILFIVTGTYLVWALVFLVLGSEGPDTSFFLSKSEHAYLAKHIGPRKKRKCSSRAPCKSIFKTVFLYGWLIADFGRECAVTMIADGFHIGLRDLKVAPVAGLQALLFFVFVAILVGSILCDKFIITKEVLTPGQVRKIYSSIGCCGSSISMIMAAYCERASPRFGFIITGQIFSTVMALGQPVSLFDISPNYAGFIFAVFTAIRCVFLAVKIIIDQRNGLFPLSDKNFDEVYYRYGFIVFITNLIFLLFGDIERKPFDAYETSDWTKESIISYP